MPRRTIPTLPSAVTVSGSLHPVDQETAVIANGPVRITLQLTGRNISVVARNSPQSRPETSVLEHHDSVQANESFRSLLHAYLATGYRLEEGGPLSSDVLSNQGQVITQVQQEQERVQRTTAMRAAQTDQRLRQEEVAQTTPPKPEPTKPKSLMERVSGKRKVIRDEDNT